MKKILLLFLLILCFMPLSAFDIAKNGKAESAVIMTEDMTEAEKNAALEFVSYIKKITDAELPVLNNPTDGNNIYFGQTETVKNILGDFDFETLKSDGILIKSGKDYLIFSGDRPRGTLYAVYSYLKDNLGCRFFTPTEEKIPRKTRISVNGINTVYTPPFMSRESYFKVNLGHNDYKFFAKNKLNGHFNNIPDEWGGHIFIKGWCHTIPQWLPVSKYGKDHPEWYAFENGKRDNESSEANICFTNKEMLEELTKVVLDQVEANDEKVIVSVSQPDTRRWCHCPECEKLCGDLGNSGALLTVVNHIAREVKKKNPNAYVETLAYQWTRQTPNNIVPEDNVIIRLCDIECDFASPLNSENNKDFYRDLIEWHNFTDSIYVWDYVVNYSNSHPVFADFHVLQKNMQIFRDNHGVAVFEEGDDFNWDTALIGLKAYLLAELMWNPDIDTDKVIKEYLDFYFGPAGGNVYDYLNVLTEATVREKPFLKCFNPGNTYLTAEDFIKAFDCLYRGMEKVKYNPKYRDRLKVQLYAHHFSLWQAPEAVIEKVTATGLLGVYDTREKFLKMYIPFSFAHNNSYGQYTVHINDSSLYKY